MKSPEYTAWYNMKERCGYANGRNVYVEKGIVVHKDWLGPMGYETFLAHIGPKPDPSMLLDRIDNNGHYVPGNVRWATTAESASNKSNNHIVEIEGRAMVISHWCKEYGIAVQTVHSRINAGWTKVEAITTPAYANRKVTT